MNFAAYLLQTTQWEPWRVNAACFDSPLEWFFPVNPAAVTPAFAICAGCMVRRECEEYAVAQERLDGIWGGKNQAQLVALRKRRRG